MSGDASTQAVAEELRKVAKRIEAEMSPDAKVNAHTLHGVLVLVASELEGEGK